jgi:hypothetical protein
MSDAPGAKCGPCGSDHRSTHDGRLTRLFSGRPARAPYTQAIDAQTGRNPCVQINAFQPRLLNAVLGRDGNGDVVRKAGIMGIVVAGGRVLPEDGIMVRLPAEPHHALERV